MGEDNDEPHGAVPPPNEGDDQKRPSVEGDDAGRGNGADGGVAPQADEVCASS